MIGTSQANNVSVDVLTRALERERLARKRAEQLMIEKCRELYQSNQEIRRTALALEKEVQRSRAVFETAAEGIVVFDQQGTIEFLNPAAMQIFHLSPDHSQLNICQLLPKAEFCLGPDKCLVTGLKELLGESNETIGITSEGCEIPLEFVVSEFEANGATAFSGIVRDLSRRRNLESKLAQAQKLESVGQLAAGIAHELNTPIQFVGNNTRFLKDAFASIEEIFSKYTSLLGICKGQFTGSSNAEEIIQEIEKSCKSADLCFLMEEIPQAIEQTLQGTDSVSRIVKAMKGFSHPGSESFQEIDVNSALESTLIVSRSEWKYTAELVTDYCPDLPPVSCLPGELNQVFLNLIVNAAHAMQDVARQHPEKSGVLTVKTRFDDKYVYVEIGDSGTGIPQAIRKKIFDPFFTTKGVGKGTGQGLAISYGIIVGLHKGDINFESSEGEGTTFRIALPRSRS